MKVQKTTESFSTAYCKKTVSGNVTEFMEMSVYPQQPAIRKISQNEYMTLLDGEIHEYKQSSNRSENKDSLRKTFRKIRDVINANCVKSDNLHWITLTYKRNETDVKQVYRDFDVFRKRLYRYADSIHRKRPEYISVLEPQSRGAWHIHLILIWHGKRPYISNNAVFQKLWGQGFTKIQGCPNSDNLGAYLSAYLGDIPVDEYTGDLSKAEIKEITTKQHKKKAFVKGGRLRLYPCGTNIFRHSRNIAKSVVSVLTDKKEIRRQKFNSGKQTYYIAFALTDDTSKEDTTIFVSKTFYNSKRKKSKKELLLAKASALGLLA